jgi:hypothetical protein
MTQQHPITPSLELVQKWTDEYIKAKPSCTGPELIATRAAQWGADQELEACCEWVKSKQTYWAHDELRAARRPKPPSLKKQALEQLDGIAAVFRMSHGGDLVCDTIRRALEQLDD